MTDDYPVPKYVVIDDAGIAHAAFIAGQDHNRYVRTYCDWWTVPTIPLDPARGTVALHPRDRFPPTCLMCARKNNVL